MNCKAARSLFSLQIDKYLSYEEERKLMQHLEQCTNCAAEYKAVQRTVGLVRDLPEIAPSETFVQDVLLAARKARQTAATPPSPGIRERIRAFFASPSWAGSPLVAPAALVLGLAVGLSGTMLALITMIGMQFGFMMAGTFVIEKVFAYPGMGQLLLESIEMRDYPTIQATILVAAGFFTVINMAVDLTYGLIDPRIRLKGKR